MADPNELRRRGDRRRSGGHRCSDRVGAQTILVERYGGLGGLAAGGLIILLLTMDDGRGQQVIAGLSQEFIDRLDARGASV
jgi:hypothetical protein